MHISITKFLLCHLFILSVLFCSTEASSRPNDRTCTADINQYGFPSNCSCAQFQRYDFHTGKCLLISSSDMLLDLRFLLTNAESEISTLQSLGGKESKKVAIEKLPQYFSGIAQYVEHLADTYQFSYQLIRKARQATDLVTLDIEFCSNDMASECTEILEQLKLTIVEIQNVLTAKGLDNVNHIDSVNENDDSLTL